MYRAQRKTSRNDYWLCHLVCFDTLQLAIDCADEMAEKTTKAGKPKYHAVRVIEVHEDDEPAWPADVKYYRRVEKNA